MREPPEIRRNCAAKLAGIETSPQFTAMLACLLGEDWTTPRTEELCISPDRSVLAWQRPLTDRANLSRSRT